MIQPRTPRTGTSRGSERQTRHDHGPAATTTVAGLDPARVGEHAGDVVAPPQQLAHGTARADVGAGRARLVGERRRRRAGVDAAGVQVQLGALDVRREQRLGRAQLLGGRGARRPPR